VSWTDTLPTLDDLRPIFPEAEPAAQARAGFHVRRAGLGVFSACYLREPAVDPRYAAFRRWKDDPTGQAQVGFLDTAAAAIVGTIRQWCPVLPSDWTVTTPPAGAPQGGTYPAGILAREVATRLDLDFLTTLQRTGAKRYHHPAESLRQEPYTVTTAPPVVAIIGDDFISSGRTMTLARQALAAAGVPSFGMAWGCD